MPKMHQNTSPPDPLTAVWGLRLRGGREVVRGEAREPAYKERAERGGCYFYGERNGGERGRKDRGRELKSR